ncbi:MAG: OsmC family peroxiredoxin [Actinomycetota bacterium]|nr:OsmC family peroxiredoxin [Actinomycetota bacterium]
MAERRAEVVWEGSLTEGSGSVTSSGSGAVDNVGVTWEARTGRQDGKTSPEELIAAAHAACFAMAFSGALSKAGHPPERLTVAATCAFEAGAAGARIPWIELDVRGRARGLDQGEFERLAEEADEGCPVSNALRGNLDIRLRATLEG